MNFDSYGFALGFSAFNTVFSNSNSSKNSPSSNKYIQKYKYGNTFKTLPEVVKFYFKKANTYHNKYLNIKADLSQYIDNFDEKIKPINLNPTPEKFISHIKELIDHIYKYIDFNNYLFKETLEELLKLITYTRLKKDNPFPRFLTESNIDLILKNIYTEYKVQEIKNLPNENLLLNSSKEDSKTYLLNVFDLFFFSEIEDFYKDRYNYYIHFDSQLVNLYDMKRSIYKIIEKSTEKQKIIDYFKNRETTFEDLLKEIKKLDSVDHNLARAYVIKIFSIISNIHYYSSFTFKKPIQLPETLENSNKKEQLINQIYNFFNSEDHDFFTLENEGARYNVFQKEEGKTS